MNDTQTTTPPDLHQPILGSILIVEDHASVRASLHDWLEAVYPDCRIQQAASGEEALELVAHQPPTLVLMDINLPGMTGLEAARRIKMAHSQTLVVVLSIYEGPSYQAHAITAGADAYVPKRTMHVELLPLLNQMLAEAG